MIIRSFILDNITMIVFNIKFFFCLLASCTICCFLELVCNKYPILFGWVIEGKDLPPFKEERRDSEFYNEYANFEDEELLTAYSRTSSRSSLIHDLQ